MSNDRHIVCGERRKVDRPPGSPRIRPVHLDLQKNIKLPLTDISRPLVSNIPDILVDLLEISSYIYCADQAVTRGDDPRKLGAKWRRSFHLHIPVRCPDVWSSPPMIELLSDTLSFLSDDEDYQFNFYRANRPTPSDQYFEFGPGGGSGFQAQSVILFSGGLDSLAGAVQEAVVDKRDVVLVSHRSSPKIANNLKFLVPELQKHCATPPLHIPVWVNKDKDLGREYTQRTRSFLYACLGAVVARIFGLWEIKFYENGVLSFNLPISAQVIGGRATRSTHPQVLNGFTKFFSTLFEKPFNVENPFIWRTKTDIIRSISDAGCGGLIKHTVSCTHTWERTKQYSHCGRCSQCVDRRFAVLAAESQNDEPSEMYKIDLLTGEQKEGIDKTMVESYVRTAVEIDQMGDDGVEFFSHFGEATRTIRHLREHGTVDEVATKIFDLHKRHANQARCVLVRALKDYANEITAGILPESCVVALAVSPKYKQSHKVAEKIFPKFPTPPNADWPEMKMKFVSGYDLSVTVRDIKNKRVSCDEMQMMDKRKSKYNKQWELLQKFAKGHGTHTWDHSGASLNDKKQKQILSEKLEKYFGILGDPIEYVPSTKGWKTRFEIEPESQS